MQHGRLLTRKILKQPVLLTIFRLFLTLFGNDSQAMTPARDLKRATRIAENFSAKEFFCPYICDTLDRLVARITGR
jgi:hypothetical protein